jgi:alanine-glyoxylate transaminase/serine-glyoxylate transaminase/serine-pyruvate transaminase
MESIKDLTLAPRLLLGPGPSMVHPRVLRVMATPLIGHLDPQFVELMQEIQCLLRFVFETENQMTFPVSGTGSAGMDACVANFVEPGTRVLVCINGYFGERLFDMAQRYGGKVSRIDRPWGEAFTAQEIKAALEKSPADLVMIVMAETSTGVLQPLKEIAQVVHAQGGLLLVDCVTSLGGIPVKIDENGIDIAYSGTQKCLSCPPGLSPVTVGPRAVEVLKNRKIPVPTWYLDFTLLLKYWGSERTYHHTAPISMCYALREALRLIQEEGLEARYQRHQQMANLFYESLAEIGLEPLVEPQYRLPSLTTVKVPQGVEEAQVRNRLLDEYNIEISGGLGSLKGKVWRIGLMGYSASRENILLLTSALNRILNQKAK